MDMSGMAGMGGGSGHDMSGMTMSGGIFTPADEAMARGFWYGVAGCVGLLALVRVASGMEARQRIKAHRNGATHVPSRPRGWISQMYATATATTREMIYPQPLYFTGRFSKYFSPLPVGRWLLLAFYWIVILCMLWSDTILKPSDSMYPYKWEKVGFRAAWVTVSQIPLVYLLSCKFNPITLLTGISYERFNWLHRWVSRTVFLTAIVHWSFFFTEWSIADIVKMEIQLMPMVKYGFGAWGIITWMVLTGFGFFRNASYELFVAQHIAAAAILLWVLFVHVPTYAQYNIWMSVGFLAFDWGTRIIWGVLRNTHLLSRTDLKASGYPARLEYLLGDAVRLTIDHADFDWKAGQHAYITIPRLRPFETHPFTIANAPCRRKQNGQTRMTMLIQARSGFSRSLYKAAVKTAGTDQTHRAFISGPWGTPPDLSHYDTLVLIACSSGASFILPLLEATVRSHGCVRLIILHWIIRTDAHFCWFGEQLNALLESSQDLPIDLEIFVHVTRFANLPSAAVAMQPKTATADTVVRIDSTSGESSSTTGMDSIENEKKPLSSAKSASQNLVKKYGSRPTLDTMVRSAVERALGETAVVVCGGMSITAESRTCVAALSDERAVHKGTGAQGIFLFTETYGW